MAINRKMTIAMVISVILAAACMWGAFMIMSEKAKPEEKGSVVVLAKDLASGSIIEKDDLTTKSVSVSAIPPGVATDKANYLGKRLLQSSHSGQFFFDDMVADRGLIRLDTSKLYLVGLDVDNISNYLGCQLKPGEKYQLYDKSTGLPVRVCTVTIDKLIDANAKDVTASDSTVKTINVGVNSQTDMLAVMSKKGLKALEIIREPRP